MDSFAALTNGLECGFGLIVNTPERPFVASAAMFSIKRS
jgi:hypothetical protein